MADPRERGRLFLHHPAAASSEIKKSLSRKASSRRSSSFGRYQDDRRRGGDARGAGLGRSAPVSGGRGCGGLAGRGATAAAGAGGGLVPSFGRLRFDRRGRLRPAASRPGDGRGGRSAARGRYRDAAARPADSGSPQTEVVRRLREAIVIIYDPARPAATARTGFFISPQHLMTNTHVVVGVRSGRRGEQDDRREIGACPLPRHEQAAGREAKSASTPPSWRRTAGRTRPIFPSPRAWRRARRSRSAAIPAAPPSIRTRPTTCSSA